MNRSFFSVKSVNTLFMMYHHYWKDCCFWSCFYYYLVFVKTKNKKINYGPSYKIFYLLYVLDIILKRLINRDDVDGVKWTRFWKDNNDNNASVTLEQEKEGEPFEVLLQVRACGQTYIINHDKKGQCRIKKYIYFKVHTF